MVSHASLDTFENNALSMPACVEHPDTIAQQLMEPHHTRATMRQLEGGTFRMGTRRERLALLQKAYHMTHADVFTPEMPDHLVTLSPFAIDTHPVTNAQFFEFVSSVTQSQPSAVARLPNIDTYMRHWVDDVYPESLGDHPVTHITWHAAIAFAVWAGKRLPTEAEWEYAARGGLTNAEFPWGNDPAHPSRANYGESAIAGTTPVGSYPPNPYGLYDLAGNVWEFCLDEWMADFYASGLDVNPVAGGWLSAEEALLVSTRRVIRGGSYGGDPVNLRVAYRDSHMPWDAKPFVGFRCARDIA
jgi:formylglycine-generating enzyme required for sulfatase activity